MKLVIPDMSCAEKLRRFRQDFLSAGEGTDTCGSLAKYEEWTPGTVPGVHFVIYSGKGQIERGNSMDETIVISVSREVRPSQVLLRRVMAVLGVLFLLQAIMFSTGFMLPCFLMVICYYWYRHASKREYEYTLGEDTLKIERVSDHGRTLYYEIPYSEIQMVCLPDAPEAMPYKKGGTIPVVKKDYTSYREGVPYYTVIVRDQPKPLKLLMDLTPEAIRMIRRKNREADIKINEY